MTTDGRLKIPIINDRKLQNQKDFDEIEALVIHLRELIQVVSFH